MLLPEVLEGKQAATGGFATSVWRLEVGARRYALRAFRAHERHVLDREMAAMSAARAAGLPTPRVYAIGTYEGGPAMVLDWCAGRPLLHAPWLAVTFGRLHRRLHRVRAPATLRANWIDWPRTADARAAEQLRSMPLRTDRLLHFDFHPLNVLADQRQITAVLDWTNAHAGDPRADFARTVTILRLSPPLGDRRQRLLRRVFEAAWRLGYGPPGDHLAPFYAWAGQAMLHDLADRFPSADLEPARRWTAHWLG